MNVFDLAARLSLDTSEYDHGLEDAEKSAGGFGSKIAKGLGTAAKVGIATITAAASGIAMLTKKSVEGFSEYEQLVGGVETLYGDFASTVMGYAQGAFMTAGKSVNDYMETAIKSSAAMINSLGGDQAKAAELTNMAITDMADNVNKMGTSMEMVENAYTGFSRGNFTMLDNLALGFAGTKEGMQELLDKAEEFSGVKYDISSYSDIVQAIHVVQEEMGIAGTTQREAAETIQGSLGMLKGAWDNLVVGMSDSEANIDQLVSNVVDSVGIVGSNLIPVVETALDGISQVADTLLPQIAEKLPNAFLNVAPKLLSAGAKTVVTLVSGIVQAAPQMIQTGAELIVTLAQGLAQSAPDLIPSAVESVLTIVDALLDNIDLLIDAGIDLIIGLATGLIQALPKLIEKAPEIIEKLVFAIIRNAPKILNAGIDLILMLVKGIISAIPKLVAQAPKVIDAVFNALIGAVAVVVQVGVHLVQGIWSGISSATQWLRDKIKGWVGNVVDFLKNLFGIHSPSTVMRDQIGKFLALGVWEGWDSNNPIDLINGDIDRLSTGLTVTNKVSNTGSSAQQSLIDYDALGNAVANGIARANLGIQIDGRDMGRIVREAVRYG